MKIFRIVLAIIWGISCWTSSPASTPARHQVGQTEPSPEWQTRVCDMVKSKHVRFTRNARIWLVAHCAPVAQDDRIGEILAVMNRTKIEQPQYREHR